MMVIGIFQSYHRYLYDTHIHEEIDSVMACGRRLVQIRYGKGKSDRQETRQNATEKHRRESFFEQYESSMNKENFL